MKIRELKDGLERKFDRARAGKYVDSISHWTKRIFDSEDGQYVTSDFNEVSTLENLASLGIVSLKKGGDDNVIAELTAGGRELRMDFMAHGYYL